MKTGVNMDFDQRVVVNANEMEWMESRLPNVFRRMLERENAESGRATTIVRFEPNSAFDSHIHVGGEEFLVLEGVFSDETGDFGPGMYIRNPVGSEHRPHSKEGCVIFVKLCQMDVADQDAVRIDSNRDEWLPGLEDGLTVLPLHQFGSENVGLVKWRPGTTFQRHSHPGGEEILVLDGVFEDEHGRYPKGTWMRSPAGSVHTPYSAEGGMIYVKTGLNFPSAS
ncbi:MAG: cupin [Rhodospirillaceae bacterium]|nr:cupin [Rhodospirillaceae bacterium]MBT5666124.1 cupin [Rhodospirillaceae bacterium]MBT5809251.1 cupin [Rhodospirillaceae bacterium]